MVRWEYKVEWARPNEIPQFESILTEWGKEGWELVNALAINNSDCERLYFKRRID